MSVHKPAAVRGHSVDCTTPFGHVVSDQVTPVRSPPVRLAPVRSGLLRSTLLRSAPLRSQPCRSTLCPRVVQSTAGATVVVVVGGTGAGVHAANNATHAVK